MPEASVCLNLCLLWLVLDLEFEARLGVFRCTILLVLHGLLKSFFFLNLTLLEFEKLWVSHNLQLPHQLELLGGLWRVLAKLEALTMG